MHILIILNLAQRKLYSHFYFLKKKIIEFFNDGNESVDICLLNKNIFALSLKINPFDYHYHLFKSYFLYTNQPPHTFQMIGISTHVFMHVVKYTLHNVRSVFPARKTTMTRTL